MTWKDKAVELALTTDMSQRSIARSLGVPKSTLNDYLRSVFNTQKLTGGTPTDGPKVLVYDIETSPVLGSVWSIWNQNIGISQIERDWFILSYAAKWYGQSSVFYDDQRNEEDVEDDSRLLSGIWKLLDEADIVITHNGKRFDSKKLNARFILSGFKPPSSYRHIDTLEIAKRKFNFTSNSLAYLTSRLCKTNIKSGHGKYPGFVLWKECLKGNSEAWEEMENYNKLDILSLEELYNILAPWSDNLPNFDVYTNSLSNNGLSGTLNLEHQGYVYTNLGKYERFICADTGKEFRGRKNLLSKKKRSTLKANVK